MEGKIYAAISSVMNDVGAVAKNDVNNFDKYKFRGIDAVMNALSPAMVKNRVFVIPEVLETTREERQSQKGGLMIYTTVKVKYTFFTDDGSNVQAVVIGEAMDRSDKSTNKAMSAAFKYACFQTFCIPTEEMQDADKESPSVAAKGTKKEASRENDDKAEDEGYPSRDEMMEAVVKKYPAGSKNEAALLTFLKIKSLNQATDAQIMAVYNKMTGRAA